MPSSVGTVRIAQGNAWTTPRRKAAPLSSVSASWEATWANLLTRSIARSTWGLPSAGRSSQTWTWPIAVSAERLRSGTFPSPRGRRGMPRRTRRRWGALRVSLGTASRRQPSTSSSGSRVLRRDSTTTASSASVRTELGGRRGPVGASAVPVLPRRLAAVFGFSPQRAAGARVLSCAAWGSARTRGVVRAEP
jgi:hypothetical protein